MKDAQPVKLNAGATFSLTTENILGDEKRVATNYPDLPRVVQPGTRLLLDDGAIALVVESTTDTDVICRVVDGGLLGERKGINLPGVALPIDSLTEKDIEDLKWAVGQNADYIALSFVRRASDCERAKQLINEAGGRAPLIAKIEKAEAIDHLDEIIAAADGVMVARGDLGVETSDELVPVYQKRIIERAIQAGKMVITATQMLQSMVSSPRPTRAEASDVANAVWDGSDCVMLSNETATGAYPTGRGRHDGAHHRISRDRQGKTGRTIHELERQAVRARKPRVVRGCCFCFRRNGNDSDGSLYSLGFNGPPAVFTASRSTDYCLDAPAGSSL